MKISWHKSPPSWTFRHLLIRKCPAVFNLCPAQPTHCPAGRLCPGLRVWSPACWTMSWWMTSPVCPATLTLGTVMLASSRNQALPAPVRTILLPCLLSRTRATTLSPTTSTPSSPNHSTVLTTVLCLARWPYLNYQSQLWTPAQWPAWVRSPWPRPTSQCSWCATSRPTMVPSLSRLRLCLLGSAIP